MNLISQIAACTLHPGGPTGCTPEASRAQALASRRDFVFVLGCYVGLVLVPAVGGKPCFVIQYVVVVRTARGSGKRRLSIRSHVLLLHYSHNANVLMLEHDGRCQSIFGVT